MKVLLVCHYFAPEIGAPQARLSEMAKSWVDAGDDVQVLTGFPNHPTGVVHEGYRGRRTMVEHRDGVDVVRTWVYATPNEGIVKKTLGHLSFLASALTMGWRWVHRPDVIVVSSPTFFAIPIAWAMAKRFRVPWVLEVRDLWPGIFVELGVIENRRVIRALEMLELAAYRAADRIVVVTDGFRSNLIERGVPAAKVDVVTNGVDLTAFSPGPSTDEQRRQLGAESGDALVVYIGAHGISQGLEAVIAAARLTPDIKFALVGEGARKRELSRLAEGLDNVLLFPGVPRQDVLGILRAADILLVPLRDLPLFETFIPSKMFEFFASGTAVIGSVDGEAATILREAGAIVTPPEDAEALATAISRLIADPGDRVRREARALAYVTERFDRATLAETYRSTLRKVVGSTTGREVGRS